MQQLVLHCCQGTEERDPCTGASAALRGEESRKEHCRHFWGVVWLLGSVLCLSLAGARVSDHAWLVRGRSSQECDATGRTPGPSGGRHHTPLPRQNTVQASHTGHEICYRLPTVDERVCVQTVHANGLGGMRRPNQRHLSSIMTSTLRGFSCSLQRRPNGAKILMLFTAPRGRKRQRWISTVRWDTSGRTEQESC